jgi:7-carboxy-7-deazaguanine synthase
VSRYGVISAKDTIILEGARSGTRAIEVRFSGCNLWDGHPLRRTDGAAPCAAWCDSDHYRGSAIGLEDILAAANEDWPDKGDGSARWIHLTGGEPFTQVDAALCRALKAEGWSISAETNGSLGWHHYDLIDWLVVSPKAGVDLHVPRADELRIAYPGAGGNFDGWKDEDLLALAHSLCVKHLYVTPIDFPLDPDRIGLTVLRHGAEQDESSDDVTLMAATMYQTSRCAVRRVHSC